MLRIMALFGVKKQCQENSSVPIPSFDGSVPSGDKREKARNMRDAVPGGDC